VIAIDASMSESIAARLEKSLGLALHQLIPLSEEVADPRGCEVLVTTMEDRDRLLRLMTPEIRWVHVLATGVDGFPLEVLDGRDLTCSRGASGVAIAEFVLAAMLAFEKRLPAQ
jgi:phosphoglycerate dehydrogenase-like enzyme